MGCVGCRILQMSKFYFPIFVTLVIDSKDDLKLDLEIKAVCHCFIMKASAFTGEV